MALHGASFRVWLLRQRRRDDRIGDLARDVGQDKDTRARSPEGLRRYLHTVTSWDTVFETLDLAVAEWQDAVVLVTGKQS